jgi:hypothetical protein
MNACQGLWGPPLSLRGAQHGQEVMRKAASFDNRTPHGNNSGE